MKLATKLAKGSTGRTFCIVDERTTGLHLEEIHKLLRVLGRLVNAGNTIVVVDHNLDAIRTADWRATLDPRAAMVGTDPDRRST